jgi:DNA polymerase (family 10)
MLHEELSKALFELADLYALEGIKNGFQLNAYRKVAREVLSTTDECVKEVAEGGDCIPGVGSSLRTLIKEFVETGKLHNLEELKTKLPDVFDLTRVPGIGVRTALKLHKEWGITKLPELKALLDEGKIVNSKWRAGIELAQGRPNEERLPLALVLKHCEPLLEATKQITGIKEACFAGSVRRKKETVKDVDILVKLKEGACPGDVIEEWVKLGDQTLSSGDKKASILLLKPELKIRVDLLIVMPESWGAALCHFTGPREHNIALRSIASGRGITINEYGIWKGAEKIGGEREEDLYELLKLPYLKPEDRDNANYNRS